MGAWAPGLFSDDTASDVRGDYRELLEDGVGDAEATQRILEKYADALADPDDAPVVWLALAFTQSKLGRLDPEVRDRALHVIDSGEDLHRWRDEAKLLAKREAALSKVREQLTGPQPARKKLRPPKRHQTSLTAGDVLSYRTEAGQLALMRVQRIDVHRLSVAPVVRLLKHQGRDLPKERKLRKLEDWPDAPLAVRHQSPQPPFAEVTWRVSAHRGVDFEAAGFHVVGHIEPGRGDETARVFSYLEWLMLAKVLDRYFKLA